MWFVTTLLIKVFVSCLLACCILAVCFSALSMSLTNLTAIANFLVEYAVLVADPVTVCCQTEGGHGVQEARWGTGSGSVLYLLVNYHPFTKDHVHMVYLVVSLITLVSRVTHTRQSSETSITKTSILLYVSQLLHVQTQLQTSTYTVWQ